MTYSCLESLFSQMLLLFKFAFFIILNQGSSNSKSSNLSILLMRMPMVRMATLRPYHRVMKESYDPVHYLKVPHPLDPSALS